MGESICPMGRSETECIRGCGGRYRGITKKQVYDLVIEDGVDPSRMPCKTIEDYAEELLRTRFKLTLDIRDKVCYNDSGGKTDERIRN